MGKKMGLDPGKGGSIGNNRRLQNASLHKEATRQRQRMKETSKRRKKESLDTYESDEMSKHHTKNTCFFESFKSYLLARKCGNCAATINSRNLDLLQLPRIASWYKIPFDMMAMIPLSWYISHNEVFSRRVH